MNGPALLKRIRLEDLGEARSRGRDTEAEDRKPRGPESTSVRLDGDLLERVDEAARDAHVTREELLRKATAHYLAELKVGPEPAAQPEADVEDNTSNGV